LAAGADPVTARGELPKGRPAKDLGRIADLLDAAPARPTTRTPPRARQERTRPDAALYADAPIPDFRRRAAAPSFRKAVEQLRRTLKTTKSPFDHAVPGAVFFKATKAEADRIVADRREKLARAGMMLFRCGDTIRLGDDECLALLPTADVYEAVAAVGTNAANYGRGSAGVIAGLREVEKETPFVLTTIASDRVEGEFLARPRSAARLARKLRDLNDDVGPIDAVAAMLRKNRRLYLWWD
jgi:hypothetical protein